MSDSAAANHRSPAPAPKSGSSASLAKRGFFARIALFLRQVFAELRKVVTPSAGQLANYTLVVLAFVVVMMVIVSLMDLVFGQLVLWLFTATDS